MDTGHEHWTHGKSSSADLPPGNYEAGYFLLIQTEGSSLLFKTQHTIMHCHKGTKN